MTCAVNYIAFGAAIIIAFLQGLWIGYGLGGRKAKPSDDVATFTEMRLCFTCDRHYDVGKGHLCVATKERSRPQ